MCCSCQAGGQKYCSCLIGNKASPLTETLKAWHAAFLQLGFGNYSAATQTRTAYVRWGRAIPASLTGCHWYTNSLSISSGFSSRLSNHYRSKKPDPASLFIFHRNRFLLYAQSKHPAYLACGGSVFTVTRADVHVFCVIALFRELCVSLKRQQTTAWKPKQNVPLHWTHFQSRGITR